MDLLEIARLETWVGPIWIAATEQGVRAITSPGGDRDACLRMAAPRRRSIEVVDDTGWTAEAVRQLSQYFSEQRFDFDLPLDLLGTPFQSRVWAEVRTVCFGETATYRLIAERIGAPRAIRAVGTANGANPVSIVVPCHRLVGTAGDLRGYAGGLERKRALIDWELRVKRA